MIFASNRKKGYILLAFRVFRMVWTIFTLFRFVAYSPLLKLCYLSNFAYCCLKRNFAGIGWPAGPAVRAGQGGPRQVPSRHPGISSGDPDPTFQKVRILVRIWLFLSVRILVRIRLFKMSEFWAGSDLPKCPNSGPGQTFQNVWILVRIRIFKMSESWSGSDFS